MHAEPNDMSEDTTNIRINTETWKRLQEYKDEPGKTWDEVMQELLEGTEGNPRTMPATNN